MLNDILPPGSRQRSLVFGTASIVALLIVTQFILPGSAGPGSGTPIALLFLGTVFGLVTAMTAVGLLLIYRTTRIINFSQSAMGAAGATFTYFLMVGNNWPFVPALFVGLIVGAGIGLLFEIIIVKRFFDAPRLVLTVMTIVTLGVLIQFSFQIVGSGVFGDLADLSGDELSGGAPIATPFSDWSFGIGDLALDFGFPEIFSIAVALLSFGGVGWFLYRTRQGIAVRAAAENTERAELLGIPIKSLSTIVWTMAGALSAMSLIMVGTMSTFASNAGGAIQSFPRALAAVVLARMRSIPVAILSAVGIEVAARAIEWSYPQRTEITEIGLLVLVVGGLLLFRDRGRSGEGEASAWETTEEVRPTPRELLSVPGVNMGRWAVIGIGGAFLLIYPWIFSVGATARAGFVLIQVIVLLSIVVLTGWSGQVSLGQWAFVAIGAVVGGAFTFRMGVSFWLALPAVAILTAAIAMIIGLPALRIRGLFLAVSTFVLAGTVGVVLFDEDYFDWLLPERVDRPTAFLLDFEDERSMYYLIVVALLITTLMVVSLRRTRTGRVLIGLRENEANIESFGINLVRTRLTAFGIAGFLCGAAGVLLAHHQRAIDAATYGGQASQTIFLIALLGGVGSVSGALLGGAWLGLAQVLSQVSGPPSFVIGVLVTGNYGILLILFLSPRGLAGLAFGLRDGIYKIVAQRRQMVVPALFEDRDPESLEKQLAPLAEADHTSALARLPATKRYRQDGSRYSTDVEVHRGREDETRALESAAAHASGERSD